MDKFQTMQVFVAVAKQGSFVAASNELGISAPATTKAIAALEARLGVKLFNRTTRHVRLTAAGARFLQDAQHILEQLAEAEGAARGIYAKPSGTLTVTAPVLFGTLHIVPIVTAYLAQYPDVKVKTLFYDNITNLLEEEIDVAIRIGQLKDSNLYATQVGAVKRIVCGAPSYFANHGLPQKPQQLTDHQIVFSTTYEPTRSWQFNDNGQALSVKLKPSLMCNQNAAALSAAVMGAGITRLMSYQAGEALATGQLQRILTEYEEEDLPVSIVHVEGRRANAKIRTFIDLAAERLRANPYIQGQI